MHTVYQQHPTLYLKREKVVQTHLAGPEVCTTIGSMQGVFVRPFPFPRYRVYASSKLCARNANHSLHWTLVINHPMMLSFGYQQGIDPVAAVQWRLCVCE